MLFRGALFRRAVMDAKASKGGSGTAVAATVKAEPSVIREHVTILREIKASPRIIAVAEAAAVAAETKR
jgi:hypothetical protein